MPLRLNVGVSRKVGLPDYGSAGASCNIELELDQALLDRDPAAFRDRVRDAYAAAQQAVHEELARLQEGAGPPHARSNGASATATRNGSVYAGPTTARDGRSATEGSSPTRPSSRGPRPRKPATASQVKAIHAIARASGADLDGLLGDLDVSRPEDLSVAEASALIDMLKAASRA